MRLPDTGSEDEATCAAISSNVDNGSEDEATCAAISSNIDNGSEDEVPVLLFLAMLIMDLIILNKALVIL